MSDFVDATRDWLADHGLTADLRAVPLRPSPATGRACGTITARCRDGIDLMLIDGPPWTIHPLTRGGAADRCSIMSRRAAR